MSYLHNKLVTGGIGDTSHPVISSTLAEASRQRAPVWSESPQGSRLGTCTSAVPVVPGFCAFASPPLGVWSMPLRVRQASRLRGYDDGHFPATIFPRGKLDSGARHILVVITHRPMWRMWSPRAPNLNRAIFTGENIISNAADGPKRTRQPLSEVYKRRRSLITRLYGDNGLRMDSTAPGPKQVPVILVKLNVLRYVPWWKRFQNRHFRRHQSSSSSSPPPTAATATTTTAIPVALDTAELRSLAVALDSELLLRPLLELLHHERIRLYPGYHKSHDLGVFSGVLLDVAELDGLVCSVVTTKDDVYSYNPEVGHSRAAKPKVSFKE